MRAEWPDVPPLVLIGTAALPIPDDPKVRHLGFVSEEEKFALIRECALLLMPSPYESLSVVVLEAWAMGRPVLVNAACRVLEGQCMRSGGGLFYRGYSEFADALRRLATDAPLRAALGRGRAGLRAGGVRLGRRGAADGGLPREPAQARRRLQAPDVEQQRHDDDRELDEPGARPGLRPQHRHAKREPGQRGRRMRPAGPTSSRCRRGGRVRARRRGTSTA